MTPTEFTGVFVVSNENTCFIRWVVWVVGTQDLCSRHRPQDYPGTYLLETLNRHTFHSTGTTILYKTGGVPIWEGRSTSSFSDLLSLTSGVTTVSFLPNYTCINKPTHTNGLLPTLITQTINESDIVFLFF